MKKVVIGMSGGVDSSVAAYLLQKEGYNVIGLFMRNWDSSINNDIQGNPDLKNDICPQEQDYNDALKVCEKLNIPLYRVDFIKEYWDYVFQYFLNELKKGRTPNPDVMCNKYIKFDLFKKEAKKLGADYIATGHYAQINGDKLLKGIDLNKDQTYFLALTSKKQLENVLFPVGNLNKQEVRTIASQLNLETALKKDSTGICFIGERNFKGFLKNYFPQKEGKIIDIETNQEIGLHSGLMYYTIGQRRGLNIGGNEDRLFVVGKDIENNVLFVAQGEDNKYLYSDLALITNINWLSDHKPINCHAKFRYRQQDIPVQLQYLDNGNIFVKYIKGKAITPGQICVFYDGNECLGGGIIDEVYLDNQKINYL